MASQWRYKALVTLVILWAMGAISAASDKSKEERRVEYEMFIDRMMDLMPPDELAEELVGVIQRRTADSDKRQKKVLTSRVDDLDDEALLERIGRLAVRWINTRLTPRSDEECSWSWGRWRCDPQCDCEYRYRFGDYAPGRSCRLRPAKERGLGTCNPEAGNDVSLLEKFASFMEKVARHTWRFTSEHVIPQTDQECRFSISRSLEEKQAVCLPRKSCTFHYKFGDLHPGRSCRMHRHSSHLSKPGKVEDDGYYYIEDDDDVDSPVGRAKAEASATDSGQKSDNKSLWYFDDEGDEEL